MAAGPPGVYRSTDAGEHYAPVSQMEFSEAVRLPSTWLFVSGQHEVEVVYEGEGG